MNAAIFILLSENEAERSEVCKSFLDAYRNGNNQISLGTEDDVGTGGPVQSASDFSEVVINLLKTIYEIHSTFAYDVYLKLNSTTSILDNNITDPGEPRTPQLNTDIDYTKLVVLTIIILFTVGGNGAVVGSILSRRYDVLLVDRTSRKGPFVYRGKVTRMYFFILHLSIADLLTAFFTLLPEFGCTLTFPFFYAGNIGCKIMKYLFMVGPYLSSYTLVMTAVDRYKVSEKICPILFLIFPLSSFKKELLRQALTNRVG